MVLDCTDDFQVAWKDPGDAGLRWGRDPGHLPRPLPPLAQAYGVRLAIPMQPGSRLIFLNGYPFTARPAQGPPPTRPAQGPSLPDSTTGTQAWESHYLPQIKDICFRIRDGRYEDMPAAELAASLDFLFLDAVRAFELTQEASRPFIGPIVNFFSFCERELGTDGLIQAAAMLQGSDNASVAAGRALAELAQMGAAKPALAEALRARRFDQLHSVEGSANFTNAFGAFLDEFGWRAESWSLIHVPVWKEDPTVPLELIARFLEAGVDPALATIQGASDQREQALQQAKSRLSGDSLTRFRELLSGVGALSYVMEARAFWQLTAAGVLRAPILSLGQKLVEAGVVEQPSDVFFLYLDELKKVAGSPRPLHDLIRQRSTEFARWETLDPPTSVGAAGRPALPPDPVMQMAFRLVLGIGAPSSVEGNTIAGSGASRGIVRGRARLIRSLADAERLERGDILVCQTTSPAWTPLFSIAAAVVTDAGGILSHSGICAREYGIPCVVGTQVATKRIPDGALLTIDGEKGTVTIDD